MNFHDIILTLHVLGAGLLIGVVIFSLLLVVRRPITPERVALIDQLAVFGKIGASWQFLTGLYLAWSSWGDIRNLTIFWLKIGLFLGAGLIIEFLIHRQAHRAVGGNPKAAKLLPFAAWLLLAVIVVIVSIGVTLVEHH